MKLSVCVVTYNQEKYIAECLQSIVDQVTDFDFEIIVGDDGSSDSTRQIVSAFAKRYKNIVPVLHEKNMGGAHNYKAVHGLATGMYIAHMDGDDLMLPGKLQAQADVLDRHPDCVVCAHSMQTMKDGVISGIWKAYPEGKYGMVELINTLPFFCHSSKMYRASLQSHKMVEDETLDVEVHLYDSSHGSIFYIGRELGIYRLNAGVSTSAGSRWASPSWALERGSRRLFENAYDHLDAAVVDRAKAKYLFELAYQYALAGDMTRYGDLMKESIKTKRTGLLQAGMYALRFLPAIAVKVARHRAGKKGY